MTFGNSRYSFLKPRRARVPKVKLPPDPVRPGVYLFEVDGPLYAYRRLKDRGGYRKYDAYKKRTRLLAESAGLRGFDTNDERTVQIDMSIRWRKGPRIDLSNVLKGLEDAIFRQDRHIMGANVKVLTDCPKESLYVQITVH